MKQTSSLKITAILPLVLAASSMYAKAAILAPPTVTGSSPAFNGSFPASHAVDGTSNDYASASQGTNTFLEFTFAAPTTFDRIVVVNRNSFNGSDRIANYTLTYDGSVSQSVTTHTTLAGQGNFDVLGTRTATTVRLDVDSTISVGSNNTGVMEVYFLNTPTGMNLITTTTAINSSTPFGGFPSVNAVDGFVGFNGGEFASTAGVNTFLEMDLGSVQTVGGFDFFDRLPAGDKTTAFDLTFSVDSIFGNGDDIVQSYTGSTQSAEFAGISAQYVRYDVVTGTGNLGVSEIQFYAIPEPSSAGLLGLGGLALMTRRRKK